MLAQRLILIDQVKFDIFSSAKAQSWAGPLSGGGEGGRMMSKLQHCFNALLSTTFYDFHFLF